MASTISFRPNPTDDRILTQAARPGETTSDTIRRALRLLDHERWLERFHEDAATLEGENLNTEAEAW